MPGHRVPIIVALLAVGPMANAGETSLSVLGIEAVEAPPALAANLSTALKQRAAALDKFWMVTGKDLIEIRMVFGCDAAAPACMAQAGKSLGVDKLMYGTLRRGATKTAPLLVTLSLLDVKTATVERSVSETVARRDLQAGAVQSLAARFTSLLLESRGRSLSVRSDPPGAQVMVDSAQVGTTPLTLQELTAGTHTVEVTAPGYRSAIRTVDLRNAGAPQLSLALEPAGGARATTRIPEPVSSLTVASRDADHPGRTATLIGVAALAVATAAAGVAIYTWRTFSNLEGTASHDLQGVRAVTPAASAADVNFFRHPTCSVPSDLGGAVTQQYRNDCNRGESYATATTALWATTATFTAGGVAALIVADRQAARRRVVEQPRLGVIRHSLRVSPVALRAGGALSAAFEF